MLKFVIGERLFNQNLSNSYITFKNYLEEINNHAFHDVIYIPGQGLSDTERKVVYRDNIKHFSGNAYKIGTLLSKEAMNKRDDRNVLITELISLGNDRYESSLVIHNDNELIQDHFTGSHIPGMIFLEASRQLARATWMKYENSPQDAMAMVINDIHCEYKKFAFLFCVNVEVNIRKLTDCTYDLDASFTQNGVQVVKSYGKLQIAQKKKLAALELSMMKKMTDARSKYFLTNKEKAEEAAA